MTCLVDSSGELSFGRRGAWTAPIVREGGIFVDGCVVGLTWVDNERDNEHRHRQGSEGKSFSLDTRGSLFVFVPLTYVGPNTTYPIFNSCIRVARMLHLILSCPPLFSLKSFLSFQHTGHKTQLFEP